LIELLSDWSLKENSCTCRCGRTYISETRYEKGEGGVYILASRKNCVGCGKSSPLTAGGIGEPRGWAI
jgi:hypothetical protein